MSKLLQRPAGRKRLADRRPHEISELRHGDFIYVAGLGYCDDNHGLAGIFLNSPKVGTAVALAASIRLPCRNNPEGDHPQLGWQRCRADWRGGARPLGDQQQGCAMTSLRTESTVAMAIISPVASTAARWSAYRRWFIVRTEAECMLARVLGIASSTTTDGSPEDAA